MKRGRKKVAETWSQKPVLVSAAEMRQPTAGLWTSMFDINRIDGSIKTHLDAVVLQQFTFQKTKQRLVRCKHPSQTLV